MFVRTKKVNGREYRQLVENVRIEGKHRQRVIVHLGQHETVEEALEDLVGRLEVLEASDLAERASKAGREAVAWEGHFRRHYGEILDRYHGGEVPSLEEHREKAGQGEAAPYTDEVVFVLYGHTSYKRAEVPRTPEQLEYCKAFGGEVQELRNPTIHGHTWSFPEMHDFHRNLVSYGYWKREATVKQGTLERKRQKLQAKIEKLESVVTSMEAAGPAPATV